MTSIPMIQPAQWEALLACEALVTFERTALRLAQEILGAPAAIESAFFFAPPPASPVESGLLLHPLNLPAGRYSRPRRPVPELAALLSEIGDASAGKWRVLPGSPGRLVEPSDLKGGALPAARATLALPLEAHQRRLGAWLLGLAEDPGEIAEATLGGLAGLASALGPLLLRLFQADLLQRQVQTLRHLHESMIRPLLAPDRATLLTALLEILTRDFHFPRVQLALVQQETQMLRSELHTGFTPPFTALAASLDNADDYLVQCLDLPPGEVVLFEPSPAEWPSAILPPRLSELAGTPPPERLVVLPLRVGLKRLGLIYADQPVHDGSPFFRPVFEIFARLAAIAVEGQGQRVRAEQRAETDPLTGLRNRYFLDKILELEIPRVKRYNTPISLLMIDLVDFKRTNDTYGHQFGDYILRESASLLQACVRRGDVVVRYGGDEFVVLMVNTSAEQAQLVRDRIEQAFTERNRLQHEEQMKISISLGLRSADARGIEDLLHEADMAMYAHKARQTRTQLLHALIDGNLERIEAAERVVGSLCNILYKKEPYYAEHARRVAHLALRLARALGLAEEDVQNLALAALLHDVGKVSMPTEVLQKTDPLTQAEIEAMRHHPALGEEFFQGIDYLEPIRPLIRSHHERFDGRMTGEFPAYPDGLSGERIPLGARILKLAESADALLFGRPYRAAVPSETVPRLLRQESGHSFDPRLVRVLLADREWNRELGHPDEIFSLLATET